MKVKQILVTGAAAVLMGVSLLACGQPEDRTAYRLYADVKYREETSLAICQKATSAGNALHQSNAPDGEWQQAARQVTFRYSECLDSVLLLLNAEDELINHLGTIPRHSSTEGPWQEFNLTLDQFRYQAQQIRNDDAAFYHKTATMLNQMRADLWGTNR